MVKNFLLGVGAQKAGTTWLWNYLCANPAVEFGFCKEYHIFDALWVDEPNIRKRFFQTPIDRMASPGPKPSQQQLLLLRFLNNPELYFKFFKQIVSASDDTTLTGDITPAYAALPVEALQYIKSSLIREGLRPKVIFLMRDPVERCISATRMSLKRTKDDQGWSARDENNALAKSYQTTGFRMRTRYDVTIANLEQVFGEDELFYGFYEEMFEPSRIRDICDFLGVAYLAPDFETKINASRTGNAIDTSLLCEIRRLYDPVYAYVGQRFGRARISALWKHAAGLR